MKCAAGFSVAVCPQAPVMKFGDRAADGQTHAHAIALGGKKWREKVFGKLVGNAPAGMAPLIPNHGTAVATGADAHFRAPNRRSPHGLVPVPGGVTDRL